MHDQQDSFNLQWVHLVWKPWKETVAQSHNQDWIYM